MHKDDLVIIILGALFIIGLLLLPNDGRKCLESHKQSTTQMLPQADGNVMLYEDTITVCDKYEEKK